VVEDRFAVQELTPAGVLQTHGDLLLNLPTCRFSLLFVLLKEAEPRLDCFAGRLVAPGGNPGCHKGLQFRSEGDVPCGTMGHGSSLREPGGCVNLRHSQSGQVLGRDLLLPETRHKLGMGRHGRKGVSFTARVLRGILFPVSLYNYLACVLL
jgi:hypothetical protein